MTRKLYSFDIETRCGLGVAVHAAMCADATLTPDQALNIARHDMMELDDQTTAYARAAGIDTVVVIDTIMGEPCKYPGTDIGIRDTIVEVRGMFKSLEDQVLIRAVIDEPSRIRPAREPKKRDWEQRNRKQKRR